jgi:hypothetical protein
MMVDKIESILEIIMPILCMIVSWHYFWNNHIDKAIYFLLIVLLAEIVSHNARGYRETHKD